MTFTVLEFLLYTLAIYFSGYILGYIWWAPTTPFKKGFLEGLTFQPLVKLFRRKL